MSNFFIQGFLLQASLILTLGAQNLFVIDVGLRRNHHLLAASICSICDLLLILLGVLGVSVLLQNTISLQIIIGLLGALFLLYYGVCKIIEGTMGTSNVSSAKSPHLPRRAIILKTLGFTLLNPHVYLDTFFLIGGYSTRFESLNSKLTFGLGAGVFSLLWFYFLAIFSSRFSKALLVEKRMRIMAFITGVVLIYLGVNLGIESITKLN